MSRQLFDLKYLNIEYNGGILNVCINTREQNDIFEMQVSYIYSVKLRTSVKFVTYETMHQMELTSI